MYVLSRSSTSSWPPRALTLLLWCSASSFGGDLKPKRLLNDLAILGEAKLSLFSVMPVNSKSVALGTGDIVDKLGRGPADPVGEFKEPLQ